MKTIWEAFATALTCAVLAIGGIGLLAALLGGLEIVINALQRLLRK